MPSMNAVGRKAMYRAFSCEKITADIGRLFAIGWPYSQQFWAFQ